MLTDDPDARCVEGCYRCLLSYYNQPDHELIDRTDRDAQGACSCGWRAARLRPVAASRAAHAERRLARGAGAVGACRRPMQRRSPSNGTALAAGLAHASGRSRRSDPVDAQTRAAPPRRSASPSFVLPETPGDAPPPELARTAWAEPHDRDVCARAISSSPVDASGSHLPSPDDETGCACGRCRAPKQMCSSSIRRSNASRCGRRVRAPDSRTRSRPGRRAAAVGCAAAVAAPRRWTVPLGGAPGLRAARLSARAAADGAAPACRPPADRRRRRHRQDDRGRPDPARTDRPRRGRPLLASCARRTSSSSGRTSSRPSSTSTPSR